MKKTSKILSMILILTLLCTGFAFAAASAPADVAGTEYETAVNALVDKGAITGDDDGLFHAGDNLTRAQACIIVVKTIDPPASIVNGTATQAATTATFSDLKGYSWAENYIAYSVKYGIVKGYPDGSFKPGNNVTTEELATMLLRAAKLVTDESTMKYPDDYMALAEQKGIMEKVTKPYPTYATKGMAALMTYSVMDELHAAAPVIDQDVPQGTNEDTTSQVPDTTNMTFASGSFDVNVTTFAGKALADDVKVYTYGKAAAYKKDMVMSKTKSDYREETVYKFKKVSTSAWYTYENGKITTMILPRDVGFSGNVYCVINNTVKTLNADGNTVTGVKTLTAAQPITWLTEKGFTMPALQKGDGTLYEMYTKNGEVRAIATSTDPNKRRDEFTELTTSNAWTPIYKYDKDVVRLNDASGDLIEISTNATVYVWDADEKEYVQGRLSAVKRGNEIRAYGFTEDGEGTAEIVIVREAD